VAHRIRSSTRAGRPSTRAGRTSTRAGRRRTSGAAAVLLALTLTACGGGSDDSDAEATVASDSAQTLPSQPGDSGQTSTSPSPTEPSPTEPSPTESETESVTVTGSDFSFSLDEDNLAAGNYEIVLVNEGRATHDLVVEQNGTDIAASDDIGPGESTTFTVTLEPGEYVLYCSIGNHRAMGMELTVEVT